MDTTRRPIEVGGAAACAAQINSIDKFALLFKRLLETFFVERMDQNETIFAQP